MEFLNKTVLITGGASGMGLLAGKCFAREGANVVLADINEEDLHAAVAEVRAITERVIGCHTDATKYEQVVSCRDAAVEAFGSIDILIPCAGGAERRILGLKERNFFEQPIAAIDFSLDMNLKAVIYFEHAVMQQMAKQQGGVIIHLGSITGAEGSAGNIGYATSKSALMTGTVKSLAQAGAPYGIRACCIAPGPVMTRPGMAGMKTLMGYPAEPQEIVDMMLYLASDKARSVTGTTILMDGGRYVMENKR
ncbi:MAG: SDR family oxidoreductase [Clostridia bacterium]|nr:SDR family oxidoreductase [Clostridia bacterium]MBQ9801988.1 SDR family oxidoreductase [Clostridia bacterium]